MPVGAAIEFRLMVSAQFGWFKCKEKILDVMIGFQSFRQSRIVFRRRRSCVPNRSNITSLSVTEY